VNIVLCGLSFSGKTTVGKQVAARLSLHFLDTDKLIDAQLSAREFAKKFGLKAFREKENGVIYSLRGIRNTVIATGGSTLLHPDNIEVLKTLGPLFCLKTPSDVILERIEKGPCPVYLNPKDLKTSWKVYASEREPIFESSSDYFVEGENMVEQIVERINGDKQLWQTL
jgi:shikimate kinase